MILPNKIYNQNMKENLEVVYQKSNHSFIKGGVIHVTTTTTIPTISVG